MPGHLMAGIPQYGVRGSDPNQNERSIRRYLHSGTFRWRQTRDADRAKVQIEKDGSPLFALAVLTEGLRRLRRLSPCEAHHSNVIVTATRANH